MVPQEHIRDAAVRVAKSFEGLSGDPISPRFEEYLSVIAPGETRHRAEEMSRMSGCALTVAAVWRAIGIDHPSLAPPYRDQTAVNRLYELARVSGALRSMYPGSLPQPGDCMWVGHGGSEHVYVVLEAREGLILGVDGGSGTMPVTRLSRSRSTSGRGSMSAPAFLGVLSG